MKPRKYLYAVEMYPDGKTQLTMRKQAGLTWYGPIVQKKLPGVVVMAGAIDGVDEIKKELDRMEAELDSAP